MQQAYLNTGSSELPAVPARPWAEPERAAPEDRGSVCGGSRQPGEAFLLPTASFPLLTAPAEV